jgi:hypothetical protein
MHTATSPRNHRAAARCCQSNKMIDCLLLWFIQGKHSHNGVVVVAVMTEIKSSGFRLSSTSAKNGLLVEL